jgi:RNA polymerase sigma factor (sigma-70 family)
MEAATKALRPSARGRALRLERSCEQLRPLGEAYVMRHFAGQLGRADAEDAVAEVLIRLHRRIAEGHPPENLRAAFFTSVRNAAIDQLRSRAAKPTVGLEAALGTPAEAAAPPEWAQSREEAARLQDALARLRGRYREAILLRFGLGLTVPEIATHFQISLPAAKKLMLRAMRHVKERLVAIEAAEFCPEMQELARRSLFEREASGLASESEAEVLRAHFAHCGSCRSFLASMHERLHDLGAAALFGLMAGQPSAARAGFIDRVGEWLGGVGHGLHIGVEKGRQLALRITGTAPGGDGGAAGALLGSGQKIAAICTAGAATTATCLLTGALGSGIGINAPAAHVERKPAAKTARLFSETSPVGAIAVPAFSPAPAASPAAPRAGRLHRRASPQRSGPAHAASSAAGEEFGIESAGVQSSGYGSGKTTASAPGPTTSSAASTGSGSGSPRSSGGQGGVGFEG